MLVIVVVNLCLSFRSHLHILWQQDIYPVPELLLNSEQCSHPQDSYPLMQRGFFCLKLNFIRKYMQRHPSVPISIS